MERARAHGSEIPRGSTIELQRPAELAPVRLGIADLEQAERPAELLEVLRRGGDHEGLPSRRKHTIYLL